MKHPKPSTILVGAGGLVFIFLWLIPWQAIVTIIVISLLLFILLGHLRLEVEKEHRTAVTSQYRPSQQQPQKPNTPTQTSLRPGLHLTPAEYNQLAKQYQQGYSAQTSKQRSKHKQPQPKQEHPLDYEQPQAQYPELPPMSY